MDSATGVFGFEGLRTTINELGNWQRTLSVSTRVSTHAGLVEQRAKAKIGHLQPESGSFAAWDRLAQSTLERKERMGYGENDGQPLLGPHDAQHMRDDIQGESHATPTEVYAVVGIPAGSHSSHYAMTQELGSDVTGGKADVPARPFLGPAMEEEEGAFVAEMEGVIVEWLYRADLRGRRKAGLP